MMTKYAEQPRKRRRVAPHSKDGAVAFEEKSHQELMEPVKLGYYDWKMLSRKDHRDEEGNQIMGQCDVDTGVIYVDDSYSKKVTNHTVMHETLHACFANSQIEGLDHDMEERVVTYLTDKLLHLFENKHLRKFLFGNSGKNI